MPYVAKGKCVYKRDTGKKVGCTKGSVKKYLSALHANVNESTTQNYDFLKDSDLIGFEIKANNTVMTITKISPYTSKDRVITITSENPFYDSEDIGSEKMFNADILESDLINGLNNGQWIVNTNQDPFEKLNESEDLEWAQDIVNNRPLEFQGKEILIDIRDLNSEEREELVDILEGYMESDFDEEELGWPNDCFRRGEYLKSRTFSISLHCGIEDYDYIPKRGLICCLTSTYEDDTNKENIIPMDGRLLLNYNLNESEDFEWVDPEGNLRGTHFVFNPPITDVNDYTNFIKTLSELDPKIRWTGFLENKGFLKDHLPKSINHFSKFVQSSKKYTDAFIDFDGLLAMVQPWNPKEGYGVGRRYHKVNGWDFIKKNITESEDDLEWAEEIVNGVNNMDATNLKGKAWEIILPGPEEDFIEAQKWAFKRGFKWHTTEELLDSSEYSYSALCTIGSIFHDNIRNSTLTYGGSGNCNRETVLKETVRIAKDNARTNELYVFDWDSNKKEAILTEVIALNSLKEAEEDDLEWAQDTVNSKPIYRFRDLAFKPHHIPGAVRARLNFPNGHYISVVGGPHLYGNGVDTFEIWGSDTDEPEGYLTKADVTNRMLELQELPPLEGKGSFRKEPITESEEWFNDVVSNPINLVGTAVYFDNGLSISEWRKFKELMRRDEIKPLSVIDLDDMDSVMEVRDKHLLFMIDENRTVAFHNLDLIKKRMAQGQEYSDDPLWRTDLSFNNVREYFNTGIYRLINGYDLTGGSITESEEDFEWAKDVIDNTDRWVKFSDIQKGDYVIYKKGETILEPGAGGFWLVGELTKCLAYNPMDWSTVSVPCYKLQSVKEDKGQRYFSGENIDVKNPPEELGHYSALFKIIDKTDWLRERGWRVPLKGNWHLRADHINPEIKINESEDLEWAQDAVNGLEQYEEYKGEELRPGTVLMITGEYEDLYFKDQWAKIVRKQGNDSYLLTFSKYIENGDSHTHCGEPEEYESDEYHCGCTDSDSQVGRCWFTSLNSMDEVKVFPNLRGFLGENKKDKPLLTEGRYDAITRKAVKDIMQVITNTQGQNDDLHQAELPNSIRGDEYEYMQDGMAFSIELNVHHQFLYHDRSASKESEAYFVNTAIAEGDDNVIMMTVVVDPNWEPRIYEKLFYKLQEDIRHEIEHLTQSGYYRIEDRPTSTTSTAKLKTVFGHHKHKLEVPALVHGFYRRAKLEKRPIDDVMMEDLDSEIEKGTLSKKQAESLLKVWIDYAQKNLPTAIYSQQ